MHGYAGKFLEVDLSTERISEVEFRKDVLRQYVGGRGLAAKILWDNLGERWETIDPLGPENILLVLTGPLTGFFPGSRICVSGKSPQSNGVIGSTTSGEFGVELKCAGWDGIIVRGVAEKASYVFIADSHVEIKDASHLWGKDGKQTLKALTREGRAELERRNPNYGVWKEPAAIYIGPAGEKKARVAAVLGKWTHAAGYGGYGAVMGSKNLKAVVVKGTGPLPEVDDIEKVSELIDYVSRKCYEMHNFRKYGTGSSGYYCGYKTSSEPVRNWQEEWHDQKSFGGDRFEQRVWVKKYWGDFGCPTTCLKMAMPKVGPFKGAITDNPDYELQAYLGTNLGLFTPEENVYVASVVDDLGICGIQGGNVLGFAAELYQRGILTKKDLGGIELRWGDARAFAALAEKIARREGIGDLLAEGTYRAALKLTKTKRRDVTQYAVQAKGVAIGAHGVRSGEDFVNETGYAFSVQGGDHTSAANLPLRSSGGELTAIFYDSAVYCFFNTFSLPRDLKWRFYEAVTGWKMTPDEWFGVKGLRILQLQRTMLLLGGPDHRWDPKVHDTNPPRFFEPLPSGPYAGKTLNKKEFEKAKRDYYRAVGWDKNGVPKSSALKRLGLGEVDRVLKEKL